MIEKIKQIFSVKDIRNKVLIVGGLLIVFRMLSAIPIPGIDIERLRGFLADNQIFGFLNIFSGGGLSNFSIMMLGVGPYITGTIIMQLLTMIFPVMKQMYYEEGATGRAKFNRYSRLLTVPLAGLQGYAFLNLLTSQGVLSPLSFLGMLQNVILISTGSLILMWLGELISEQKIGNGVSVIIFGGIVSRLPTLVQNLLVSYTPDLLFTYAIFVILAILVIAGVVFISEGERKVPVTYAKRVRGNKMYGGTASYLPMKVNQAGVIPIIFAISILLFPQFIAQMSAIFSAELSVKLQSMVAGLMNNQWVYGISYFLLVVIFTYFYTSITFNPEEISKNLQQSGGFVPGIRPGEPTTQFLKSTSGRITLFGSAFLGIVAILPIIVQGITGIRTLYIGGTALLIVVSVALEISRQINSQLVMRDYEGIQ